MNNMAIGKNIHRRLLINGVTQKKLAEEIHVTQVTMSRWINGERNPSVYGLYRIAKYLGVTMEELMEGIEG